MRNYDRDYLENMLFIGAVHSFFYRIAVAITPLIIMALCSLFKGIKQLIIDYKENHIKKEVTNND